MRSAVSLERAAFILTAITYGLLVFGASVRVAGAGLACPDWPLCFGEVIPAIDFGVAFEFGHRVLAGGVSLGFLLLAAALWRAVRAGVLSARPLQIAGAAAVVLAIQIVLGGLTVLHLLAEWTVTSHLLAGNTFCLLLLLIALQIRSERLLEGRGVVALYERLLAVSVAVLLPVQLSLGGLLSSSYAGLACGSWPTCDGVSFFPMLTGPVGLQVWHRLVAYGLLLLALAGAVVGRGRGRAGLAALLVALLATAQACIGIANVLLRLPVEVTLLHTAGAAAVVLSVTWWNFEVWMAALPQTVRAPAGMRLAAGIERDMEHT